MYKHIHAPDSACVQELVLSLHGGITLGSSVLALSTFTTEPLRAPGWFTFWISIYSNGFSSDTIINTFGFYLSPCPIHPHTLYSSLVPSQGSPSSIQAFFVIILDHWSSLASSLSSFPSSVSVSPMVLPLASFFSQRCTIETRVSLPTVGHTN